MLQQPVVVTSSKTHVGPPILKTALGGQSKKFAGGKSIKPTDKGKKHVVISMPGAVAGPSSNLRSKLCDKAKVTAAMIQELTEELQAIDQESLTDEQGS